MTLLINKNQFYRLMRFAVVGAFNTILDLTILNLLVYLFIVNDPLVFSICKGVSFIIAVVNSFFMNKYFTFNKKITSKKDFYMFFVISIIGLFINILISSIMFYLLGLYPNIISIHFIATISGIIGAMFTMIINYISYSYFVFK